MSDKVKHHNDELDSFSQSIKDKLYDHRSAVDSACWGEIEQRMAAVAQVRPKTKKNYLPVWISAVAAAIALLVALFFVTEQNSEANKTLVAIQTSGTDLFVPKKAAVVVADTLASPPPTVLPQHKQKVFAPVQFAETKKTEPAKSDGLQKTKDVEVDIVPLDLLNQRSDENEQLADNNNTEKRENKLNKKQSQEKLLTAEEVDKELQKYIDEYSGKKASGGGWQLAATLGSQGSAPTGNKNLVAFKNSSIMLNSISSNNFFSERLLTPSDFSDFSHSIPLSFGINVRKDINKRFALESGLTYTYLSTHFTKRGTPEYEADLRLHYLGVPLNLITNVWTNKSWSVYISAGGMIEKGLRSVYTQNRIYENKKYNASAKTDIDGFQFSLNAATGISYRLSNNWNLYFEPRISYFFDNDQPMSIRTEKPLVFGLNGGIRFDF